MTIKDYRYICAEIEQRETQLNNDKQHVVDAVQTAADFPYWKHTIPIEGDLYPYDAAPIKERIRHLYSEKAKIERRVAEIDTYIVRRAVEVRYIEPCDESITWEKTAQIVGYVGGGHALKQLVNRELKKYKL